jgi:hypothetical protein
MYHWREELTDKSRAGSIPFFRWYKNDNAKKE